ncbi:hypothetical protein FQA39_LY16421 [Lamprigera yunnana]|nr:hypothetical protein FQA39_LY16421 [Lamprigera yunnana]
MVTTKAIQELEQILKAPLTYESVKDRIEIIEEVHKSICSEKANEVIVSFINRLINVVVSQGDGYKLLNSIVLRFSKHLVLSNYTFWMNTCFASNYNTLVTCDKLQVLEKIILMCKENQDFHKFMVPHVHKIVESCLMADEVHDIFALHFLNIIIQNYTSNCVVEKDKIEKRMYEYLCSDRPPDVIAEAANVFLSLSSVGGSSVNQETNWSTKFKTLIYIIHTKYNDFFGNFEIITRMPDDIYVPEPMPKMFVPDSSTMSKQANAATIISNTIIFMKCMIEKKFPHTKCISLKGILDVVTRGLTVDVYEECNESLQLTQLAISLYAIQIKLLYFLRSLLVAFKCTWLPFLTSVTKIILDSLQRTEKTFFDYQWEYDEAVLNVLSCWCEVVQCKFNRGSYNKMVYLLLERIKPKSIAVKLNVNMNQKLVLNRDTFCQTPRRQIKGRDTISKISGNNLNDTSATADKSIYLNNKKEKICLFSLTSLATVLQNVYWSLDEVNYNSLYKVVVNNITLSQYNQPVHPYTNLKCLNALYNVFYSLFFQENFRIEPLLQTAIRIFSKGSSLHQNQEIATICNGAMNFLEAISQPVCPTLDLPDHVKNLFQTSNNEPREDNWHDTLNKVVSTVTDMPCAIVTADLPQDNASETPELTPHNVPKTVIVTESPPRSPKSTLPLEPPLKKIKVLNEIVIKPQTCTVTNEYTQDVSDDSNHSYTVEQSTDQNKSIEILDDSSDDIRPETSTAINKLNQNLISSDHVIENNKQNKHVEIVDDSSDDIVLIDDDEEHMMASFHDTVNYVDS